MKNINDINDAELHFICRENGGVEIIEGGFTSGWWKVDEKRIAILIRLGILTIYLREKWVDEPYRSGKVIGYNMKEDGRIQFVCDNSNIITENIKVSGIYGEKKYFYTK